MFQLRRLLSTLGCLLAASHAHAQLPDDSHWYYDYGGPSSEPFGVEIAGDILRRHRPEGVDIDAVLAIIDQHDTLKEASSPEDALVKDADKGWRFSPHGVETICGWFGTPAAETLDMLEDFVLPQFLTDTGRIMARAYLAAGRATFEAPAYLKESANV